MAGKKARANTGAEKTFTREEWGEEQNREETRTWATIKERASDLAVRLRGRPPFPWTTDKEDELLNRIANGQSLASICEADDMPSPSAVFRKMERDDAFRERYYRAREQQGALLFDQCLQIADDDSADVLPGDASQGIEPTVNHAAIARAKLRIETRFRMAGKYNVRFAEKAGTDAVTVNHNTLQIDARTMDVDQREQLRAMLIAARDTTGRGG
jgi:hypothetical protein